MPARGPTSNRLWGARLDSAFDIGLDVESAYGRKSHTEQALLWGSTTLTARFSKLVRSDSFLMSITSMPHHIGRQRVKKKWSWSSVLGPVY